MPAIDVRLFRPDDVADLVALFRASVRVIARRDYTDIQVQAWAPDCIDHDLFARRCLSRPTWIAESEQRIAGFADLEPNGHIDLLYVHPQLARRGVARTLITHIEQFARERGLARLYTEASITARPVFEALGFQLITAQTVTLRGVSMTNHRMEKWLQPPAGT
jgi:putative acetyltransferase